MIKYKISFLIIILNLFISCQEEQKRLESETNSQDVSEKLNQVVVISKNAPEKYFHSLSNDSLGDVSEDSPGPKFIVPSPKFSFKNSLNRIVEWTPKVNSSDTLTVEVYTDIIELSTNTPYTLQRQTYLLQKGDTVIFRYENNFPVAEVLNRKVEDAELNYTRVRLKELFNDKFPSHLRLTLGNENGQLTGEHIKTEFYNASKDTERELDFIDSLYNEGLINAVNRNYRISATKALMNKHSKMSGIGQLFNNEKLSQPYTENLKNSDSLIAFHHFRDYLKSITTYNLPTITKSYNAGGKFYLNSRKRFDSIVKDDRFGEFTRNYLLLDAYNGIGSDFGVEDKSKYFTKLQETVSDRESLKDLQNEFGLDFSTSEKMVLRTSNNELTSYSEVIKANRGKFLFLEYWASWCTPCNQINPGREKLISKLKDEGVTYIRQGMNDRWEEWLEATRDSNIEEYFIENANVSKVVEDLGIVTIPHFMILDTQGNVVEGFADRPGKGAFEQISAVKKENGI